MVDGNFPAYEKTSDHRESNLTNKMHSQLQSQGWISVEGIKDNQELLALARELGNPTAGASGGVIAELSPKSQTMAKPKTFASSFGKGSYPLHTDTAFWEIPCQYLVMRVEGDLRRATTLCPLGSLLSSLLPNEDLERSVWVVSAGIRQFYCSLRFSVDNEYGWRWDPLCMRPVNAAAERARHLLNDCINSLPIQEFEWQNNVALIISNWHVMHGRGAAPNQESTRTLYRIYVK